MEGLELAQIFGSLAAGLGAFYSSHNKKLPYLKSILSMFIAIVFFLYWGRGCDIHFN